MNNLEEKYDIIVVGAGHAGCEAALAAARMGFETICFTVSMDSVALMPCNPNIGGSSKGHLVKEIDALGGEMGKNIDKTYLQSKMLNKSKGPAVHSLRAQADKKMYSISMTQVMGNTPNLTLRQGEVTEILVEDGKIEILNYNDGCVFTVTKVDSNFIENIGNNIFYKFNKFEDFLAFCTYIKNMNWSVFESFSLFLLNSTYYLHSFNNISNNLDSILCEFSTKKDFSSRIFRYFK